MFSEWKCGCIASINTGQVRLCPLHFKDRGIDAPGNKVVRRYPANGTMVMKWNGGK